MWEHVLWVRKRISVIEGRVYFLISQEIKVYGLLHCKKEKIYLFYNPFRQLVFPFNRLRKVSILSVLVLPFIRSFC